MTLGGDVGNTPPELVQQHYSECMNGISMLLDSDTSPIRKYVLKQVQATILNRMKQLDERSNNTEKATIPAIANALYGRSENPEGSLNKVRAQGNTSPNINQMNQGNTKEMCSSLDHMQNERESAIENTIIRSTSFSGFNDVAGLQEAKTILYEALVFPTLYPKLFEDGRQTWRHILLYGPPGTGKSRLASAVAAETNSILYSVSSADLVSSWVGESEKLIRELFRQPSRQTQSAIIFVDEIDSVCRARTSTEDESTRRMKTEFLRQMDGINNPTVGSNAVFFLCATNCPWDLDPAFLRRCQKRICVPLPDIAARKELIELHCVAARMNRYSGNDIAICVHHALLEPIRELRTAKYFTRKYPNAPYLMPCAADHIGAMEMDITEVDQDLLRLRAATLTDFVKAIGANGSSISQAQVDRFTEFQKL
eukprot:CFRG6125T1